MENSFPGGGGGCCRCQPRSPSRGHLQRRGGGKAGAVLHHRPSRLRGEAAGEGRGGGGSSPARSSPVPRYTHGHTHSAATAGARRPLCLARPPSQGVRASGGGEAGRCGGLRLRVCRGLRGRRGWWRGTACLCRSPEGEPGVCQWRGRGMWGGGSPLRSPRGWGTSRG